ncbi:MAG: hypothetical protein KDB11_28030, partial [Planctomycetales bacterium]|nr:hypothetical protein [Planctomycetales bacterium]
VCGFGCSDRQDGGQEKRVADGVIGAIGSAAQQRLGAASPRKCAASRREPPPVGTVSCLAALGYGAVEPCLWGCLIRSPAAALDADQEVWTIVSTRSWRDGMAAW